MADMKFKFTIQPYQTEAVDSVVDVFAGQPFNDRFTYLRDTKVTRDFFTMDYSVNYSVLLRFLAYTPAPAAISTTSRSARSQKFQSVNTLA